MGVVDYFAPKRLRALRRGNPQGASGARAAVVATVDVYSARATGARYSHVASALSPAGAPLHG